MKSQNFVFFSTRLFSIVLVVFHKIENISSFRIRRGVYMSSLAAPLFVLYEMHWEITGLKKEIVFWMYERDDCIIVQTNMGAFVLW